MRVFKFLAGAAITSFLIVSCGTQSNESPAENSPVSQAYEVPETSVESSLPALNAESNENVQTKHMTKIADRQDQEIWLAPGVNEDTCVIAQSKFSSADFAITCVPNSQVERCGIWFMSALPSGTSPDDAIGNRSDYYVVPNNFSSEQLPLGIQQLGNNLYYADLSLGEEPIVLTGSTDDSSVSVGPLCS